MKKQMLLLGVLIWAGPAFAGIDLSWNECATSPEARSNVTFSCSDPTAVHRLFMTFYPSIPVPDFIGLDFRLDIQIWPAEELPPFWHYEPFGCNEGLILTLRPPAGMCAGNANPWRGTPLVTTMYEPGRPVPNWARLLGSVYLPGPGTPLTAGTPYAGFHLDFAMEAGQTLEGCDAPGAAVMVSVALNRASGPPVEEAAPHFFGNCVGINDPAPSLCAITASAEVSTQAGSATGSPCGPTRVAARTWGTIKSLYR